MKNKINNFSYVIIGRIFAGGLQAVFYLVFAFLLEPTSYGQLSYVIALAGVFSIISRFGLNHTIVVYQAKQMNDLVNNINFLLIVFTLIASIILLFIDFFAALICFASSLFIMNIQNMIGLKEYKKYSLYSIGKGILHLAIPLGLYFLMGLEGILWGMIIIYFLFGLNFFKFARPNFSTFSVLQSKSKTLIHNFGVDASINFVKHVDKIVIAPLFGLAYVGIFQLNVQILYGLEILPLALHSFLLSEESSGRKNKKVIVLAISASIVLAGIGIILGPLIIENYFPKYAEGAPSLQIIILAIIPLTISSIVNAKLQSKESTKVGFSAIVRIGSLIILLIILGNEFSLIGLAFSVLISSILYMIFLLYLYVNTKNKIKF